MDIPKTCDICRKKPPCRMFIQAGYDPPDVYLCEDCYQDLQNEMYPDAVKAMEMLEMGMDHEDWICPACDGTGIDETGERCKYFDLEEREKCVKGIVKKV